ncbi:hypothetical protein ElyMa_002973200 [Elysia marginata]|uniref:Uncharacterized protein n=1 Tax=Elysia marginata TaxID=1093978 RepID=A0AAV4IB72_9GAST|nr:hypothetical protein ElyMa_002973200 [Elysia marginata]
MKTAETEYIFLELWLKGTAALTYVMTPKTKGAAMNGWRTNAPPPQCGIRCQCHKSDTLRGDNLATLRSPMTDSGTMNAALSHWLRTRPEGAMRVRF